MKKFAQSLFVLFVVGVFTLALIAPSLAQENKTVTDDGHVVASSRVVLLLAPFVTWDDITPSTTPHLYQAALKGAIGDINARSRAKGDGGNPSIIEGALTVSAGAWAKIDATALAPFDTHEQTDFDTASQDFERITGMRSAHKAIVYLGLPKTISANDANPFNAIVGLVGQSIEDAGGHTAALGNSDSGLATDDKERFMRPAALAAMNRRGMVDFGSVSNKLLKRELNAPFGVSTDLAQMKRGLSDIKSQLSPAKPSLIVVDSGDLYRASMFAPQSTNAVAQKNWTAALKKLDDIYALATEMYPSDTIILAAQASKDKDIGGEGFGPIIISNMKPGLLLSNSTQRAGLVTNMDLSATILNILGIKTPVQVLGSPMESTVHYSNGVVGDNNDGGKGRIAHLMRMNKTAVSIENNRPVVLNTFIILTVAVLVFGAVVIIRAPRHWSSSTIKAVRVAIRMLILGVLCVPASSWLMFLVYRWPSTPIQVTAQLLAVVAGLWLLTVGLSWRYGARVPLIFLSVLTSLVIIIDQVLGAPASFTSFFGYSPIAAARFYGIGNEGAAVLFGAVVIGIVMALDQWPHARWSHALKVYGIPVLGFITMFVSAAPMLGANVGVAAWATVGFVLLWFLVNEKKITWKSVLLMVLIIVLVVGVFIGIDKFGSGQETHLGRAVDSAQQGGFSQFWEIVVRKMETNFRVLMHTNLVWILLAVIGYLGLMRWRPAGEFATTLKKNPSFGSGMTAILITGAVAYFTEDSGVVLPALMVLYLGCGIVWLMLDLVVAHRGGAHDGDL